MAIPRLDYPESVSTRKIVCQQDRITCFKGFSQYALAVTRRPAPELVQDGLQNAFYELSTYVLSRTLETREASIEVPASWWDHFKQWLGYGSVRKKRHRFIFTVKAWYPGADVIPERLGKPVVFSVLEARR